MNSSRPEITPRRLTSIVRPSGSLTLALICTLRFTGGFAAEAPVTRGELLLGPGGAVLLAECGANRVLRMGAMASTPYFNLTQNYAKTSKSGKFSVLAEVKGQIKKGKDSESSVELVIESPTVLSMVRGTCAGKALAQQ